MKDTYLSLINQSCNICHDIDLYISSGSYVEDEFIANEEQLLGHCCAMLQDAVRELGFFFDENMLPDGLVTRVEMLLNFLNTLSVDFLTKYLETKHKELDDFQEWEFDLENEELQFNIFLNKLLMIDPYNKELSILRTNITELAWTYNTTFLRYLKDVINSIHHKDDYTLENISFEISELIKIVNAGREEFKKYVNLAIDKFSSVVDREYLKEKIITYDLEKLQAGNINNFCLAMLTSEEVLKDNPVFKEYKDNILLGHKLNNSHHIEYYFKRQLQVSASNLVELIAHHLEPGDTKEEAFQNALDMLKETYRFSLKFDIDIIPKSLDPFMIDLLYFYFSDIKTKESLSEIIESFRN